MKHPDAIFSREETSPDGSLRICYITFEGEKSPAIVEPCVTMIATGEVLFDFWGSRLKGHLDGFDASGFRLTVSDNYNVVTLAVRVDIGARSFTIAADPTAPRPLSAIRDTLFWSIDGLKTAREEGAPPHLEAQASSISRLKGWFR